MDKSWIMDVCNADKRKTDEVNPVKDGTFSLAKTKTLEDALCSEESLSA